MKKIVFVSLLTLAVGLLSSCEKANKNFTGTWSMTESCSATGPAGPYTITLVSNEADEYKFTIQGLWEVPASITTCVIPQSNKTTFTAAKQTLNASFDVEVNSGSINSTFNTLTFTYSVYNTGGATPVDVCTVTATN